MSAAVIPELPATEPAVLVVGSLNADLVVSVGHLPLPGETVLAQHATRAAGGKGANQAVAARSTGVRVLMAGAVGDDDQGRAYRWRLTRLGVDASYVGVARDDATGQAIVVSQLDGDNHVIVLPGANRSVRRQDVHRALETLRPGDVVLLQLEIRLDLVEWTILAAADRDLQVILNLSPYADLSSEALAAVDVLVVNEGEAMRLADLGSVTPQSMVVTLGAAGASWDGEHRVGPRVPEHEVRDTTGAGDAFCGVLAAMLAQGYDRDEALDAALAAGAAAVRYLGAQPDGSLLDPPGAK